MATRPLDKYIKTPPPTDANSSQHYLEQQLNAIQNVLDKHTTTIEDNFAQNNASITTESGVRATADSALAASIQSLTATVNQNNNTTNAAITTEQTARAAADSALATSVQTLSAKVDTNLSATNASIANEQKTRATADSALASSVSTLQAAVKTNAANTQALIASEQSTRATADTAEATARLNLSAYVGYTDGQSYSQSLAATISSEQTARVAADTAIAQNITSTSAGATNVFTQSSAPSTSGRHTGDIWYDTSNNFTPYVFYSGVWNNNSSGAYNQYAGNNATVTTFQQAYLDPTNGLGYKWGVYGTKGVAGDGVTPAIILTGGNRVNPSTGTYDTAVNKLVINANTEINGDLIVSGTITGSRIGTAAANNGITTSNLMNNSVTSIASSTGSSGTTGASVTGVGGASILVIASITSSVNVTTAYTFDVSVVVSGSVVQSSTFPLRSFGSATPVALANGYISASSYPFAGFGPYTMWGFSGNDSLIPVSVQVQYAIPTSYDGQTINVYIGVRQVGTSTYLSVPIALAIWQFKK